MTSVKRNVTVLGHAGRTGQWYGTKSRIRPVTPLVGKVNHALKCFTLINELRLSASQVANRSET